jgi:hypothetical protein
MFIRQEAEALVDLLEANAGFQIHDHTALDMATELREMFGMCTKEQEAANVEAQKNAGPGKTINLNVTVYEDPNFSKFPFIP